MPVYRVVLLTLMISLAAGLAGLVHLQGQASPVEQPALTETDVPVISGAPAPEPAPDAAPDRSVVEAQPEPAPRVSGRRTYLLAGVTPNYDRQGRRLGETFRGHTDTLLVVQVDPHANVIRTLSVPRDTLVHLPGVGQTKINGALPRLGPDGLVRAVERVTGVRVDAYLLINLGGVRDLTDAAGGVTLTVPRPMHYDDHAGGLHIHLNAGTYRMNGEQAEGFIRYRMDGRGDIGRTERQREFMEALRTQLLTPGGIARLPLVAAAALRNTRGTLGAGDVPALIGLAGDHPTLETHLLPGSFYHAGGSYWQVDEGAARQVLASFHSP